MKKSRYLLNLLMVGFLLLVAAVVTSTRPHFPEPPPDQVILATVLDFYASTMDPVMKKDEVLIVSVHGRSIWIADDRYNERDAAIILESWKRLGASAGLIEQIPQIDDPPPKWAPEQWPCRTPIRDDRVFSQNWGGLETMGDCLEVGGPSRTVLHLSRPISDPRTGYVFVVVHDWDWALSASFKLYRLSADEAGVFHVGEVVDYELYGY